MTQYDSQIFVIFSWLRSPAPGRKHSEALLLGLTVPRWNRFNPLMDTGWRSLHCWDSQTPEKLMLSNGSSHLESTKTNIKMKWNHLHNDSGISQDMKGFRLRTFKCQSWKEPLCRKILAESPWDKRLSGLSAVSLATKSCTKAICKLHTTI